MKEILIAVATSLIASIIFWGIFNYVPNKKRYNKVRPKVEFDIYEIFLELAGYIRIALKINEYCWSFSMNRVDSGRATKQDFNLWLQNKCLNDSYKFDDMAKHLIPVGPSLEKAANSLREKIDESATYYTFMTANEILLLRRISAKLFVYSYDDPAISKIKNTTFYPVVPNISYMAENFYELSKLYLELQEIVWSYKNIDRSINKYIVGDFNFNRANKCYIKEDFTGCIHYLKKAKQVSLETKQELLFRAYYAIGDLKKAQRALKKYFEIAKYKHTALTHLFNDEIVKIDSLDDNIWDMFARNYTDIEIMEVIKSAAKEKAMQQQGAKTAEMIRIYYSKKLDECSNHASEQMKDKGKNLEAYLKEVSNNANDDKSL